MLILILILLLVFGGGGGYYGDSRWGPAEARASASEQYLVIVLVA